jgi:hypothetical protein
VIAAKLSLLVRRQPLLSGAAALTLLGTGLVTAVHHLPRAGPFIANSLRAVVGIEGVARLEETVASVEDTAMRLRWHGEARSLSAISPVITSEDGPIPAPAAEDSTPPSESRGPAAEPATPSFALTPIPPPYPEVAARGDGVWVPVADPEHPGAAPVMYETLLHPDPERRWSELFIVAMPTSAVRINSVPGTAEPSTDNPAADQLPHRGLIPSTDQDQLLAAFNGGFRAEHGHHGMFVDGVTLLPPRQELCTVAGYGDGTLRIGTYSKLTLAAPGPLWYRQTARCMLEDGALHPGLRDATARGWGSTLEGETVIRRSSIALNQDGSVLYVAVTNYTTARALALGMRAAGGWNVAQLDVNFSFPKFLLFPRDRAGVRHAASLFKGFLFGADEMLEEPAARDFFYVVRRHPDVRA